MRSPAGLDLGAIGPEEIALSIIAEIVAFRRGRGHAGPSAVTATASFAAPAPSCRGVGSETLDVMVICIAAFPIGLALDRWFGLLPALTARCGGFETFEGSLEWHWACMPATSLMMLFAAPAWIGPQGASRRVCADRPA